MIGTWHSSCFACTCTTSDDKSQRIARGFSLLPACAIGRPASSSRPGRSPAAFDHQKTTHRGLGACHYRDGASRRDALFPADRQGHVRSFVAGSVRFLLPLTQLRNLAGGFGFRPFSALSQFNGIGRRANAPFAAVIQNGRQGTFQRLAKCPHSHIRNSRLNAINLDRGGHDEIHEHSASGAANDR